MAVGEDLDAVDEQHRHDGAEDHHQPGGGAQGGGAEGAHQRRYSNYHDLQGQGYGQSQGQHAVVGELHAEEGDVFGAAVESVQQLGEDQGAEDGGLYRLQSRLPQRLVTEAK